MRAFPILYGIPHLHVYILPLVSYSETLFSYFPHPYHSSSASQSRNTYEYPCSHCMLCLGATMAPKSDQLPCPYRPSGARSIWASMESGMSSWAWAIICHMQSSPSNDPGKFIIIDVLKQFNTVMKLLNTSKYLLLPTVSVSSHGLFGLALGWGSYQGYLPYLELLPELYYIRSCLCCRLWWFCPSIVFNCLFFNFYN